MQNKLQTEIMVKNQKVRVIKINDNDYISLTDLAKFKNQESPGDVIIKWMSNKSSFDFYFLWEKLNNRNFNLAECREVKNTSTEHAFTMSPSKWIKLTNSIGFITKTGKYNSGTYAHSQIAFEFASWLSPEFKLYLMSEFERLKKEEMLKNNKSWEANRIISKANYLIHTSAIREYIVPDVDKKHSKRIYAEEADVLNVALFGLTAKEWRKLNPKLAEEGNIRDYADIIQLIVLSNLENINAEMLRNNIPQLDRLIKLNSIAKAQTELLCKNKSLELLSTND